MLPNVRKKILSIKNIPRCLITIVMISLLVLGAFKGFRYAIIASTPLVSFDEIQKMVQADDYDGTIKSCKRRLMTDPNEYYSLILLGNMYEEKDTPRKSEVIYRRLLKTNNNDPLVHFYLGRSLYRQNKIDAAIASIGTSQSLAEGSSAAEQVKDVLAMDYGLLGEIYTESTKEYRKAIVELKKLLILDPANAHVRYQLGTAYAYSNQYQNAFREYDTIVKENPNTDIARYAENAIQYVRERRHPGKSKYFLD